MQSVVDPGPAAQFGEAVVIGCGLGGGGALQQGGARACLATAHQRLQPGDEGGDADTGAHPERGGRVWQGEGAIGAGHDDGIPHPEVLVQPVGVIPEGAHRQGQGAAVRRDIDQGVGMGLAAPGEVEEGELARTVARQGGGQGDPDLKGTFVQRGEGADRSLAARILAHPAKQGVERAHGAQPAPHQQGQTDRRQDADARQQAEPVQPAHQVDDRGQPVDHLEALVAHHRKQAHHHQGQQQIETPFPQGIAEFVPQGIVASASTAACRPGQPVGGDGPLGGFHQQPVGHQGAGGPERAAAMQVQHAIQPATPGFEPGQAQGQQQGEGHGTEAKQTGQDQQFMAPGPEAGGPLGHAKQPDEGEG
ncbi:hypothetical protein D3C72_1324990 [compost metagenome]